MLFVLLAGCAWFQPAPSVETPQPLSTGLPSQAPDSSTPASTLSLTLAAPTPSTPPETWLQPELPVAGVDYKLKEWTPEEADALLEELVQAQQSLRAGGKADSSEQQRVDQALLLAAQDALWRFPQASQAEAWRWLYAAELAGRSAAAAPYYAGLVQQGLQSGRASPESLLDWLQAMEPAGVYSLTTMLPLPGQDPRLLLSMQFDGQPAFFWMVKQEQQYQVAVLSSGREFQSGTDGPVRLEWQDLTGDGIEEAWVIGPDRSRRWEMATLSIYDVSSGLPQRLDFQPRLPALQAGSWQVLADEGLGPGLLAGLRVDGGDAVCEYRPEVIYRWNGQTMRLAEIEQPSLDKLAAAGFSDAQARLCLDMTIDWLRSLAQMDEPLALQTLDGLLDGYPYGATATLYVGLYPADEADRARFEMGLSYARQGDISGARRWLEALIARPGLPEGAWPGIASAFLAGYGESGDLRGACLESKACYGSSRLNLQRLTGLMQPEDWADPLLFLKRSGVPFDQGGARDFDGDSRQESWWIEPSGGPVDRLWFLAAEQGEPWLGRLDLPAGSGEVVLNSLEPLQEFPVYELLRGDSRVYFLYGRREVTQPPFVVELDPYRRQILQEMQQSLLNGNGPHEILRKLVSLQQSPYFNCNQPGASCQPLVLEDYLFALSSELSGEPEAAADAYLRVWQNFPDSSYAVLARARLIPE